ncbi:hypothetical protein VVR12_00635 [Rothia sp. LK2588]|uniref:hypothetical protein n=1 Tax=Rothia sp. LK2588 TaxID=3114369 RepID=UPI0034CF095F
MNDNLPDTRYAVRATALGGFPGTDFFDAVHRVRGELGDPHLPFLPVLEARGFAAGTLARTIACMDGLTADGTAAGWRVREGRSREGELAAATFASDINILADVVGAESHRGGQFKLQLLGPISLAHQLHLHHGERALADSGARRDIRDAFIAGLDRWLDLLQEAVPQENLVLHLDEPCLRVSLAGEVPTSSGFSRYRAVPEPEAEESLNLVSQAAQARDIQVILNAPEALPSDAERTPSWLKPFGALCVPVGLDERSFEPLAAHLDAGRTVLALLPAEYAGMRLPEAAHTWWRLWRSVGVPASSLSSVLLCPPVDLTRCGPGQATAQLGRLTELARAVSELAAEQ